MFMRFARVACCLAIVLAVSGCASLAEERGWIDNPRALNSMLRRPAKGTNDERAYLNRAYLEKKFASVKVFKPSVLLSPRKEGEGKFLADITAELSDASLAAMLLTERFDRVYADKSGVATETELGIEAWVHLATSDFEVVADPLYGENISRLVVIFTLTDTASGDTVAKYTANLPSQWGYPARVREEMREKTAEAADELGFLLYDQ